MTQEWQTAEPREEGAGTLKFWASRPLEITFPVHSHTSRPGKPTLGVSVASGRCSREKTQRKAQGVTELGSPVGRNHGASSVQLGMIFCSSPCLDSVPSLSEQNLS